MKNKSYEETVLEYSKTPHFDNTIQPIISIFKESGLDVTKEHLVALLYCSKYIEQALVELGLSKQTNIDTSKREAELTIYMQKIIEQFQAEQGEKEKTTN